MTRRTVLGLLVLAALLVPLAGPADARRATRATAAQLLGLDVRPVAIGHRGFGQVLDEDPARPIENTVAAVRAAFEAGASVVEIDVQRTADGRAAVYHNDLMPDETCVNAHTLAEIQAALPHVPSLEALLEEAGAHNRAAGPLQGIVIVELKTPVPLCDPADALEHATVAAAVAAVRRAGMTGQVLFTSFSPALLVHASLQAPHIPRILSVSAFQFLSLEQIQALHIPITVIDKRLHLGLQWGEIGGMLRLPGYRSMRELLATAIRTRLSAVEADLPLFALAGAPFVRLLHTAGLKVLGFTADTEAQWDMLEAIGVDGIYTNDVPLGVRLQAPVP